MTIYVVTHGNAKVEFASEQSAQEYATQHNCAAPESVEVDRTVKAVIPDVTPRQMRQALVLSGVSMTQIEDALATLPEPTKTLATIEWEYSTMFLRANPLVTTVGTMLGWTEEQLDDLWRLAATL